MAPYAQQVSGVVGPYAKTAKRRGARVAYDAVEKLGPALEDALDKVPPAVETARNRLHDQVLQTLAESLAAVAAVPVVVEAAGAAEPGKGAASDLRRRWLKRVIIVVAVGGVAAIVARKLLSSSRHGRAGRAADRVPCTQARSDSESGHLHGRRLVRGNRQHLRCDRRQRPDRRRG